MKKIYLIVLFLMCSLAHMQGQKFQVAVLEPTATQGTTAIEKAMIRGELIKQLSRHPNYAAFSRMDIDQIMSEQNFQRTGMVNDASIKKIGELQGVDFIAVSKITKEGNTFYLEAYLVNIESGQFHSPATEYGVLSGGYENMLKACAGLAQAMVGQVSSMPTNNNSASHYGGGRAETYVEQTWGIDMKFVWVEGGSFLMGCTSEQGGACESDEQNVRRVNVDGFYIGQFEVTQSQWEKVMGTSIYQQRNKANPQWDLYGTGPDYPMYYVSWEEANEFCRILSQQTGKTFMLPTEAQWEYAARGGNKSEGTKYAGSNVIDVVAWYTDNSGGSTHAVGTRRANALGIYDMSGNVWEWCKDWYGANYANYDTNNPQGPSSGSFRVIRGGSWYGSASNCRVSYRSGDSPGDRNNGLGFRVVLVP